MAPYQEAVLQAIVEKRRVAVRAPRGGGKCLDADQDILLADGRYLPARELVGRHFGVLSLQPDGALIPALAFAWDNGVEDVYRVTTKYGHELLRTSHHPLLRFGGWTEVKDLVPGDRIAMPTALPVSGQRRLPDEEVKLLAYLIGDGSLTGSGITFTQAPGPVADEFVACVAAYGCDVRRSGEYGYAVRYLANVGKDALSSTPLERNPIAELIRSHGLAGKSSWQKRVPAAIFELPNDQIALFLSRLFATDGWAVGNDSHHTAEVAYASVCRGLCVDVQRLLLRLGIVGRVRKRKTICRHNGRDIRNEAWEWAIRDSDNVKRFAEEVGIYGKERQVQNAYEIALRRMDQSGAHTQGYQRWPEEAFAHILEVGRRQGIGSQAMRDHVGMASRALRSKIGAIRVRKAAELLRDPWLDALLKAGVGWDTIVSIENLGPRPTVGITVPGPETFVGDVFEHNSMTNAVIVHWFALTRDGEDWKIITTAGTGRQLFKFLWPEIRKWARRLDWQKIGREPYDPRTELMTQSLRLTTGEASAVASDKPDLTEGAHADCLLYLFDESKVIPDAVFDAAEGAFSNAGPDTGMEGFGLAVSTPGEPVGRFYDIHARKPGLERWHAIHITLDDALKAKRISAEWVSDMLRQYGLSAPQYQNQVLGEFCASDSEGLIPPSWVEAAIERWEDYEEEGFPDGPITFGLDVARGGSDKSVCAIRQGDAIRSIVAWGKLDTMGTVERVIELAREWRPTRIVIDVGGGLGAGPFDRLRELNYPVAAFNGAGKADRRDRTGVLDFANRRASCFWNLRDLLSPESERKIALPKIERLIGDLTLIHQKSAQRTDRILIESKDDIRARIGRSTDHGDAVSMSFWEGAADDWFRAELERLGTCPRCGDGMYVQYDDTLWRCASCRFVAESDGVTPATGNRLF